MGLRIHLSLCQTRVLNYSHVKRFNNRDQHPVIPILGPLWVIEERIRKIVNVASRKETTGRAGDQSSTNPLDYICGLFLLDALPQNVRDQIKMHMDDDLSYVEVLNTSKKIY